MSIPFNQSIRSLRADREWSALTALLSAILMLILWLVWFVWAPIPLYEYGEVVGISRSGMLLARFSDSASTRLQPGQPALLKLQNATEGNRANQAISAFVMDIGSREGDNTVTIAVSMLPDSWFEGKEIANDAGTVLVEVEVAQISPAQWFFSFSGQWVDTSSVLLRPQPN